MIEVIAAISGGGTVLFGVAFVVLSFMSRKDNRELLTARELVLGKDNQIGMLTSELDLTRKTLTEEQAQRRAAEQGRDQARARLYPLLRAHIKDATDDEIRDLTGAAFGDFGVVPVPKTSEAPGDGLINPWPDMPPA